MRFFSWLFGKNKKPREIKLGLALGSGGAKGFAELGALRAFEENGIAFDVVAGASIGSIVGAFYADGYSSTDITELIKGIDVSEIKNFFMMKMDTSGLFNVIDRTIGSLDIEDLKKPFAAVATNMRTGEETVFKTGSVAKALCASSCYPPFFKPVNIDGEDYIDGAFSNSVPADVVREFGADFVVGIDLSTHDAKPGFLERIFPTYKGNVKEPWTKGYERSDVMLHPDLSAYKAVSFAAGAEMYDIGYKCATEHMAEIKEKIEDLKYPKRKKKI